MPFTARQLHCLNTMGIVPWVERRHISADIVVGESVIPEPATTVPATTIPEAAIPEAAISAVAAHPTIPTSPSSSDAIQLAPWLATPLLSMPFKGSLRARLGRSDAPLLVLVEKCSSAQSAYPFEPADAKIFEDMLRAIEWQKQNVCLALLPSMALQANGGNLVDTPISDKTLTDLLGQQIRVILHFTHEISDSVNRLESMKIPDQSSVTVSSSLKIWQLPHPSLLRAQPDRKRAAWNVLKAAKAHLAKP